MAGMLYLCLSASSFSNPIPLHSARQSPEHEGSIVYSGLKYVLRSDIMYHVTDKNAKEKKPRKDEQSGRRIQYE